VREQILHLHRMALSSIYDIFNYGNPVSHINSYVVGYITMLLF